jgi:hypothetical protein
MPYSKKSWPALKASSGETTKSKWLERIEITIPIIEIIDEKFYGLSQFLTPKCVLFGGTVVACANAVPFDGDIDIAVSPNEHQQLVSEISNSPKFVQESNSLLSDKQYRGSNLESKIKTISNFATFGGKKVQIISSPNNSGDSFEDALEVVRGVDFSCCAIAADIKGQIFETVKGAYDDCIAKRLRIIRTKDELSVVSLKRRINKYIGRGFTPVEDYADLILELETTAPPEQKMELTGQNLYRELARHMFLSQTGGVIRFVVNYTLFTSFPKIRVVDFISNVHDILYDSYLNFCTILEDDSGPEIIKENDGYSSITFSFYPYDPNMNWKGFEKEIINYFSRQTKFFN